MLNVRSKCRIGNARSTMAFRMTIILEGRGTTFMTGYSAPRHLFKSARHYVWANLIQAATKDGVGQRERKVYSHVTVSSHVTQEHLRQ
uniref:Thymidylate synthase n=1 Tax=Steinernema glaseri TaxID=37863 RepID=A0A1I8AVR0_9BILA